MRLELSLCYRRNLFVGGHDLFGDPAPCLEQQRHSKRSSPSTSILLPFSFLSFSNTIPNFLVVFVFSLRNPQDIASSMSSFADPNNNDNNSPHDDDSTNTYSTAAT
jgi:hypothetical protein